MSVRTNTQKMAQAAWERLRQRELSQEFASFAREFPSLIHSCGLAQAVAFALAKKTQITYIDDLCSVLSAAGHREAASRPALETTIRDQPAMTYVRLSRNALAAAGWLKRYTEALKKD